MFGGLHIEKLLLEIHGQPIAGSGLAQFLDQVKISITGAANAVVNVSQITSFNCFNTCFNCVCALNIKH